MIDRGGIEALAALVGEHPIMVQLRAAIENAARRRLPVVVAGETGVGKELVVRALHAVSACPGRLISVNVAALPEQLAESELFGAERGAYSGAHKTRDGLIQAAASGTLFLDEAANLAPALQVKLLRVLEAGMVRRVGATLEREVSTRMVVAVQRDPRALVREGCWRADFHYRVSGMVLRVPPLRERLSDVAPLAATFLRREGRPPLTADALKELKGHDWPGNVRELLRVIQRAVVLAEEHDVGRAHVRESLSQGKVEECLLEAQPEELSIRRLERQQIERQLRHTGYQVRLTAAMLGISVATLYRRLKTYGIVRPKASLSQSETGTRITLRM